MQQQGIVNPGTLDACSFSPSFWTIRQRSFIAKAEKLVEKMEKSYKELFLNEGDSEEIKQKHLTKLRGTLGQGKVENILTDSIKVLLANRNAAILKDSSLTSKVRTLKEGQTTFVEEEVALYEVRHPKQFTIKNNDGSPIFKGVCRSAVELKADGTVSVNVIDVVLNYNNEKAQEILDKRTVFEKVKDFFKSILGLNEFKALDEKAAEHLQEKAAGDDNYRMLF
jgi:hypothetical protein